MLWRAAHRSFAGNRLAALGSVERFEFSSPTGAFSVERVSATIDNDPLALRAAGQRAAFRLGRHGLRMRRAARRPCSRRPGSASTARAALDARHETRSTSKRPVRSTPRSSTAYESPTRTSASPSASSTPRRSRSTPRRCARRGERGSRRRVGARHPGARARLQYERRARPRCFQLDGEPFTGRLEIVTNAGALPANGIGRLRDPATLLTLFGQLGGRRAIQSSRRASPRSCYRCSSRTTRRCRAKTANESAEAQSGLIVVALVGQGLLTDKGDRYRAPSYASRTVW